MDALITKTEANAAIELLISKMQETIDLASKNKVTNKNRVDNKLRKARVTKGVLISCQRKIYIKFGNTIQILKH